MEDSMQYTLVNANQLRYFGTKVQDNPTSDEPLHIMTEDNKFNLELKMSGTVIFADTYTPSAKELHECPHIVLSSPHEWELQNVKFHSQSRDFQDEMQLNYNVTAIDCQYNKYSEIEDSPSTIFDIASINNRIINSVNIQHVDPIESSNMKISSIKKTNLTESELSKNSLDVGDTDLKLPKCISI